MANPFLVLGGIAIGIVTAGFGILQVPGWVANAQDASVVNDLSNIRNAQAAAVSQNGQYAHAMHQLRTSPGLSFEAASSVALAVDSNGWCATSESESGSFFAASDSEAGVGKGATAKAAATDIGCTQVVCEPAQWSGIYFDGQQWTGPVLAAECLTNIAWTHYAENHRVPGVPPLRYSSIFTRTLTEGAGTYTFDMRHDDSARVYIDGVQVYEYGISSTIRTFSVELGDGPHEVVVWHKQGTGGAHLSANYTFAP